MANKIARCYELFSSGLLHGDLFATGAGDVDLSFSLGNAQHGAAMLTFEITVGLSIPPFIFLQEEVILDWADQL